MNIDAVVVTYNRLELLKENINALKSIPVEDLRYVHIIDNHSDDGTPEYLSGLKDPRFIIHTLKKNIGGAGGFSYGIRTVALTDCDWIWIMDDDTIPNTQSLKALKEAAVIHPKAGLLSSIVVWTDNTPHRMNFQNLIGIEDDLATIATDIKDNAHVIRPLLTASFVSLMINKTAVFKVGLPYKEFFIWGDDSEYTKRIHEAGFDCLYVSDSIVLHKTKVNSGADIKNAHPSSAWKFYYGMRNETFIRRLKYGNGIYFRIKAWNHYRLEKRYLSVRPKEEQKVFLKEISRGYHDGLKFCPEIEYV